MHLCVQANIKENDLFMQNISLNTRKLEFCCSLTLPFSSQKLSTAFENTGTYATEISISFNKRPIHNHCCLGIKNARGGGSAVNLLEFTLLPNVTTTVVLLGNSACMRVGTTQQSTWCEIHIGIQLQVHYTGLVDDPADSDQEIQILSVLPYCY